jgi:hypothetical protein
MLWFGRDFLRVFLELFDDLHRHQNIQSMVIVIPIQLNATVEVAVPIFGEFVLFLEAFDQMVDIFFVDVFHAKLLTTRVIDMGRVACFHSPGVCLHS